MSAEVRSFAAEHGVTDYLVPVLRMARHIFPHEAMTVRVESDAEVSNIQHLLVDVDSSELDADQLFAAQTRWTRGLFENCPSTHVHLFCLGVR